MTEQASYKDTLYTIDKSGRRKWVYPNLADGKWWFRRATVAYLLMTFYLLMPWITIKGKQGIFLDFSHRKFTFFGTTFWATDTILVVITLAAMVFSLFFFTALFGRIWCGWACPETVFLEFLFRPIERLIEGTGAQRLKLDQSPWNFKKISKKFTKHALCAFFSWIIASTALAYIIGREPLLKMMMASPLDNPFPFFMTLALMGLMAFQFGWFREQFCTVVCPYARFQSVLLDSDSLVVGYDPNRGEPRGKRGKSADTDNLGDCVDCGMCVRVCPTGIDIRNGLQLECIHCTQCMDACDSIMDKVGKPKGLIRYDTENELTGNSTRVLRPRVIVYSIILVIIASAFVTSLATRKTSEFRIVRGNLDRPFTLLEDGKITNHLHVRISNKSDKLKKYTFTSSASNSISLTTPINPFPVPAGGIQTMPLFIHFNQSFIGDDGKEKISITMKDETDFESTREITLLGPGK
ncbi:MAG: cytochrome c oxidase accessory protein CcoG [Bdellovibrionota bacterium]